MRLYAGLVLAAAGCGVVSGTALILSVLHFGLFDLFVIPIIVFSLLVPIGCSCGFAALGIAAGRGSGTAFYASWVLAGVLTVPVGMVVFFAASEIIEQLVHFGLPEEPQRLRMKWEMAAAAALAACLGLLVAVVVVGFRVLLDSPKRPNQSLHVRSGND